MSSADRREGYIHNRVLIDSSRVLDAQFSDTLVFLTGAQVEMLRNVVQYLNRWDTYVSEYQDGYYITPSAEDYDSILAIVADLEEELMGNPNVIWGYNDRWSVHVEHTVIGDGAYTLVGEAVPNGYVYTLQSVVMRDLTSASNTIPKLWSPDALVAIGEVVLAAASALRIVDGLNYTLKYGDKVQVRFYDAKDGDEIEFFCWGYKTVVPEE